MNGLLLIKMMMIFAVPPGDGVLMMVDGSALEYQGEPDIFQNMVRLETKEGERLLLSKGLVDWPTTWERNPDLVASLKPETARVLSQAKAERTPRRPIVINNEILAREHQQRSPGLMAKSDTVAGSSSRSSVAPSTETIAHGDKVTIGDHLDTSRIVVFDFYADWCGPCRHFTPQLMAFAEKYPERMVVKKVDIVRWGSPVASQFGIKSIPYVQVYDRGGRLLKQGSGGRMLNYLSQIASREQW
jgi:thiol-disulfide isomerase/thioredoxin